MIAITPVRWAVVISLMVTGILSPHLSQSQHYTSDTLIHASVKLNDTLLQDSIQLCITSEGSLADANELIRMVGGQYYRISPLFSFWGMMIQYGKNISFTGLGYTIGFCNCQEVNMIPPATSIYIGSDSVYFAPLAFLSGAIGGSVVYNNSNSQLSITVEPPDEFGSEYPPAAPVAKALQDSGFIVQQGGIYHANAIQFCAAGYVPNCNGNNASFPYFIIQMPPPPGMDSPYSIPLLYNFKQDEAVVAIGLTPPRCKYFSYRSYLVNRLYTFPVLERIKVYASLGDTKNLYAMREDKPADSMFQRKVAIIMAADSLIANRVKTTILASTNDIFDEDIYFDIVPHEIYQLGIDPSSDWGNFLHRASLFDDAVAGNQYIAKPTLEILRVTPSEPQIGHLFATPPLRSRTSGNNEFYLLQDLDLLEEEIWEAYSENYEVIWLQPGIWLIEGYPAIQERIDVLGEVRDALYMSSSCFSFQEDDIVMVYGVNHTKTGKAVYTNVSCYGEKYKNGFGGITNKLLAKTARQYIADTTIADCFFAYKFSRHPIPGDPHVYIVPADTLSNLMGINVTDTAFMAFRAYIDTLTKVGPDEKEVILDRAVLLRPLSSAISEKKTDRQIPELNVFPNPFAGQAILEILVPEWSDVEIILYNASGQKVGTHLRIDHVRGIVRQDLKLSGSLSPGIYYLHGIIRPKGQPASYPLSAKLVYLGGTDR